MKKGKSWKTTLAGIGGGVVINAATMLDNGGHFDMKALALGAVLAILGVFAKDNNVTGGNKDNQKGTGE